MDVRDVPDQLHPRTRRGEVQLDEIGDTHGGLLIGLHGDAEGPWLARHQPFRAHDLAHKLRRALDAGIGQVGMDPSVPDQLSNFLAFPLAPPCGGR